MYMMLLPRINNIFHSSTHSSPTISFASDSKIFMVPSSPLSFPLKIELSLSLTSTGLYLSCLIKSAGLRLFLAVLIVTIRIIITMIGAFLETILLFINAIAILNEKRFLKKRRLWSIQTDSILWLLLTTPTRRLHRNRSLLWWWSPSVLLGNVQANPHRFSDSTQFDSDIVVGAWVKWWFCSCNLFLIGKKWIFMGVG